MPFMESNLSESLNAEDPQNIVQMVEYEFKQVDTFSNCVCMFLSLFFCMDFHWVYPVLLIFVLGGSSSLVLWLRTCHNKGEQGKVWESIGIPTALEDCSGICQHIVHQIFKGDGQREIFCSYTLTKYFPRHRKMLIMLFLMKPM